MNKDQRFSNKDLERIGKNLWQVHTSLYSIGSLLQYQVQDDIDSAGEWFGIGEVLKFLSKEISKIEEEIQSDAVSKKREKKF